MNTREPFRFFKAVPRLTLFAYGTLLAFSAAAQPPQTAHQDPRLVRQTVESFLRSQTTGLPGDVSITVGSVDARTNMPACAALHPFLPNGSRAWGKTTVGVRCKEGSPWTLYVQANVQVQGDYYVTAAPLAAGVAIDSAQIVKARGDLAALPAGVVTDPAQVVGKTLTMPVMAGTPLRQEILRSPQVVQQGQVVRIVSHGPGFSVSNEGRALGNGAEGQIVQARTSHGQVVSGIAQAGGILVVTY